MAKRKKRSQGKEQPAAGGENAAGKSISKSDALREAIRELGEDAKNSDLADYIRSKHGEQAVPASFTVAKSTILKKLRQGAPARGRRDAQPVSATSNAGGISLGDLRQIKDLARRYGKDPIKEVLDLLG